MLLFSKYSGLGNDFIFIDDRNHSFDAQPKFIQNLCHRKLGIGADGVVLVQNSEKGDVKMRIYNANGQEAEMCGNALRCLHLFLEELGFSRQSYLIETYDRLLKISKVGDQIICQIGEVCDLTLNQRLLIAPQSINGHFVNTGVPHFVIFVDEIEKVEVENLGRVLSNDPFFGPDRSNINFAQLFEDHIEIRTFERGVEEETLACGTGAAATAVIAHLVYHVPSPVLIKTRLKEYLKFKFDKVDSQIENLEMIGPAKYLFSGKWPLQKVLN